MNHDEYKELLSAFLDGELSEAERAEVLLHLETCEACQMYLAELNAMRASFDDIEEIDVPADFAGGVLARLHEETAESAWTPKAPKRRTWRSWAAMAACAAVVLLAGSLWRFTHMGGMSSSAMTADSAAPETASLQSTMTTASSAPATAAAPEEFEIAEFAVETADTAADNEAAEYMAETPMSDMANGEGLDRNAAPGDAYDEAVSEKEAPVLTLRGEGAEEWLEENAEPLGEGKWRVTVEAVNALPDTLSLLAADLLQEPVDGTLIITFETTENPQ